MYFKLNAVKKSANMRKYDFPAITANEPKAMNGQGMILFYQKISFHHKK